MQPKLSIVLTIYNMEACLPACLDSLAAQTFSDYEIICIDDGSSDGSPLILAEFAEKRANVTVVTQENKGPAEARNRGLHIAQGEYVMLLDSDDIFLPTLLEKLTTAIEATGADIAICRSTGFDHATGKEENIDWAIRDELLPERHVIQTLDSKVLTFSPTDLKGCLFTAFMGWPWDKIYRAELLKKHGILFPDLPNAEDLFFVYYALAKAEALAFVDETLIKHRVGRGSSVSSSRLHSPRSFYNGICLLKESLMKDAESYRSFEWGFLNWAFDYTIWNINTLPTSTERTLLTEDFVNGRLTALEMRDHPLSYYSLYPDNIRDFKNLQDEVFGTKRKGKAWENFAYICSHFQRKGLFGTIWRIVTRKLSR